MNHLGSSSFVFCGARGSNSRCVTLRTIQKYRIVVWMRTKKPNASFELVGYQCWKIKDIHASHAVSAYFALAGADTVSRKYSQSGYASFDT
jgi:hypothetical protein